MTTDSCRSLFTILCPAWRIASNRSGRRAQRPPAEYREPTDEEWTEFQQHFQARKLSLGECGRPYGAPCQHEHACLSALLLARRIGVLHRRHGSRPYG
uniref:hypothetical protein n=1 Tax=Amycolatopsis sp. CA-293810 TaxID=3239926 RepID=UPI003F491579